MFAVGINLGTTNSAVAIMNGRAEIVPDGQGNRTLPSAIGWDPDLDELVVGIDARDSPDLYNTTRSVKRLMGTDEKIRVGPYVWTPEEWSAEILKALKKQVEDWTGESVTDAIITLPAHFDVASMTATKDAGRLAGLNVQALLPEPWAAVMAYGPAENERFLVYDLGGGTFDVTIVDVSAGTLKTLAVFGNNCLGGDDFDERLIEHFIEVLREDQGYTVDRENAVIMSKLRRQAESVKIGLSRRDGVRADIPNLGGSSPIGLSCAVKRDDFNAMIMDLVDDSLKEVEKALNHAKLDRSEIDTILLIGGSTFVPLVREKVKGFFGREPTRRVDPVLAVSLGAATCLVLDDFATVGAEARHVVTVNYIPEATPDTELNIDGRTSPNSTVTINGGAEPVECRADEEGYYDATIPLRKGLNALTIAAIDPNGKRAEMELAPVVYDDNLEEPDEDLPAPPAPRLSRALSMPLRFPWTVESGYRGIEVLVPAQTDLPVEVRHTLTLPYFGGDRILRMHLLEGDLPIAEFNSRIAEVIVAVPASCAVGDMATITCAIDENTILNVSWEFDGVVRAAEVRMISVGQSSHLMRQLDSLLMRSRTRMRPEEEIQLDKSRNALEELAEQCHRSRERWRNSAAGDEFTETRAMHDRFYVAAGELRQSIESFESRYA